jgi:DNA-binding response OmpR family regulator
MKILVVDDEKKIADVMSERLGLRGFDATPVYDGKSALSQVKKEDYDGMILDLRLPDMTVVIVSGHGSEQDFNTCLGLGAVACFHKPVKIAAIAAALE